MPLIHIRIVLRLLRLLTSLRFLLPLLMLIRERIAWHHWILVHDRGWGLHGREFLDHAHRVVRHIWTTHWHLGVLAGHHRRLLLPSGDWSLLGHLCWDLHRVAIRLIKSLLLDRSGLDRITSWNGRYLGCLQGHISKRIQYITGQIDLFFFFCRNLLLLWLIIIVIIFLISKNWLKSG